MKIQTTILTAILMSTAVLSASPQPVNSDEARQPTNRPWYHYIREKMPAPHIPKIAHFKLRNGIEVWFLKSQTVPLVSMQVYLEGGSFETPQDLLGMHGLWGETAVFSGSEGLDRDGLSQYLETRASSFSFSGGAERSSFNISSMTHYFERDVQTLFGVLQKPRFAEADFEILRRRILQELDRRDENPSKWAALGLSRLYWGDTVRGRYATRRTVTNVKVGAVRQWHNKMWRGERMTIAVSGDVDEAKLRSLLDSTFGMLEYDAKRKPDLSAMHVKPAAKGNELRLLPKEIPQTTVVYKAPGMKHSDPDYYALRIFDFLLGGDSFNSYLTQKVRTEKGWAYTAYSTFETDDFTGSLLLFTQTANANLPDVIALIDSILAEPQKFVTAKKIEEAKLSLRNKFVFLFENPGQYLRLYLQLKWDGLPADYLANYSKNIAKVTEADVLRVARQFYQREKFTLLLCGPEGVYKKKSPVRPAAAALLELEK